MNEVCGWEVKALRTLTSNPSTNQLYPSTLLFTSKTDIVVSFTPGYKAALERQAMLDHDVRGFANLPARLARCLLNVCRTAAGVLGDSACRTGCHIPCPRRPGCSAPAAAARSSQRAPRRARPLDRAAQPPHTQRAPNEAAECTQPAVAYMSTLNTHGLQGRANGHSIPAEAATTTHVHRHSRVVWANVTSQ